MFCQIQRVREKANPDHTGWSVFNDSGILFLIGLANYFSFLKTDFLSTWHEAIFIRFQKVPRGIKQSLASTGTWCDIWPRGEAGNWNLHLLPWFLSLFVWQNTQARAVMEWKGLLWLIIQGHILVTGAWSSGSQKAEWWAVPSSPFSRGSSLGNGAAHS